jgi:hypothetical protein
VHARACVPAWLRAWMRASVVRACVLACVCVFCFVRSFMVGLSLIFCSAIITGSVHARTTIMINN